MTGNHVLLRHVIQKLHGDEGLAVLLVISRIVQMLDG